MRKDMRVQKQYCDNPAMVGKLQFTDALLTHQRSLLSGECCSFLSDIIELFADECHGLLAARKTYQQAIDEGKLPKMEANSKCLRENQWHCYPIPPELLDRKVEQVVAAPNRKQLIVALNSKVKSVCADFDALLAPTWTAVVEGHINLRDAAKRSMSYSSADNKHYQLHPNPAVLLCRVRGLHQHEKHITHSECAGAIPASLIDFGLYFFHSYQNLIVHNSAPYFALPHIQSWQEAAWWSKVFCYAEERFSLSRGTIKATVAIETLPAALQMHEILFSLKEHAAGLSCDYWNYVFSYCKTLHAHSNKLLSRITQPIAEQPCMSAYAAQLVAVSHKRGVMAIGDPTRPIACTTLEIDQLADCFRAAKTQQAEAGFDGTQVYNQDDADSALAVFDHLLGDSPNQLQAATAQNDPVAKAQTLLTPPEGSPSQDEWRGCIERALLYLAAWMDGMQEVQWNNQTLSASCCEASRMLISQWIRHGHSLDDGTQIDSELFARVLDEVRDQLIHNPNKQLRVESIEQSHTLLKQLATDSNITQFVTQSSFEPTKSL